MAVYFSQSFPFFQKNKNDGKQLAKSTIKDVYVRVWLDWIGYGSGDSIKKEMNNMECASDDKRLTAFEKLVQWLIPQSQFNPNHDL